MSGSSPEEKIRVLIVDDIPETREQIKKLLMFEPDIDVVGTAGSGLEGLDQARDLRPDVILMDINMPDMDGIQATEQIATAVPSAAVVMMSVQSEADYLRRAMLAGAKDFLTKPVSGDDLYNTLRKVHARNQTLISQLPVAAAQTPAGSPKTIQYEEEHLGFVIVVYSPKGGAGCTTIATNLAAGLMQEGSKVLIVDAKPQFGDVGVFLNLRAPTTIVDLCESVNDMDMELVENVLLTHDSGLRVLLAPEPDPLSLTNKLQGTDVAKVIEKLSGGYDFVIVDTGSSIDDITAELFDLASRLVIVCPPTLSGVRNIRSFLRLLDESDFAPEKALLVINQVMKDRGRGSNKVTIATELIEKNLKMTALCEIPQEERVVLHAVNRGVPVIAISKERDRSPIKELLDLAEKVRRNLVGEQEIVEEEQQPTRSRRSPWPF